MAGMSSKASNDIMASASGSKGESGTNHTNYLDVENFKLSSDTVKKNPKMEFSQADLLKLLSYLEGELQAREVVIAALKSENVKQYIYASRSQPVGPNDPLAALYRDKLASVGNLVSRNSSAAAAQSEQGIKSYARQHLESLEQAVQQQRQTHLRLVGVINDSEEKHKHLLHELEEERKKHERDTAQGDDITYGLEIERTRLRQDLEAERQTTKRLEKEARKTQESIEAEQARQKTIVVLLLAERKRIITKYMEEQKRSQDLGQILSEEKLRSDSIAQGLEEESQKSLRMEADLEKQMQAFKKQTSHLTNALAKSDIKILELEQEVAQLKLENEFFRKQQQQQTVSQHRIAAGPPQLPQKSGRLNQDGADDTGSGGPLMSNVTKVVQPTATVSSVPVSGPTTGIARSISPGQTMRQPQQAVAVDASAFIAAKVVPRKLSNVSTPIINLTNTIGHQPSLQQQLSKPGAAHPVSTIKKNPAALPLGRGVPPPIPPNKPVVPPKREPSVTRMGFTPGVAASATTTLAGGRGVEAAAMPMATGVAAVTSSSTGGEETI